MRFSLPALAVLLLAASVRAEIFRSSSAGVEYAFDVPAGPVNQWDPAKDEAPLASPRIAFALATEFMKDLPIKDDSVWVVKEVALRRVDNIADQWVYVVSFYPGPKTGSQTRSKLLPPFNVVVTLNGKIAPLLKKIGAAPSKAESVVEPGPKAAEDRDSQAHYLQGLIYYEKGDYEKARREWAEAVRLDPNNHDAKLGLERIEKLYGSGQ
jgi:tetratricopeptide (TPR) repeat protein